MNLFYIKKNNNSFLENLSCDIYYFVFEVGEKKSINFLPIPNMGVGGRISCVLFSLISKEK